MLKKILYNFLASIDEVRMKQDYGDKPGEYRPRTLEELRKENPEESEEVIGYLYEYELENWDLL